MAAKEKDSSLLTMEDRIDEEILEHRQVLFSGPVDNGSATEAIRRLWFLEFKNPGKPILFIINSPGGSVDAGMAIWDQIKMLSSPVTTLVTGIAASMGSILSLCAAKGRRFATPNSRIMVHQPAIHGVIQGQATDLDIQAKQIIKTRDRLINLYVEHTGKDFETIRAVLDRDAWMTAAEALDFGLLDKLVTTRKEIDA